MQGIGRQNDGVRDRLIVIDMFSKYSWVALTKSKNAATVTSAFRVVLSDDASWRPRRLYTDKGKEFFYSSYASITLSHNIHLFASKSN